MRNPRPRVEISEELGAGSRVYIEDLELACDCREQDILRGLSQPHSNPNLITLVEQLRDLLTNPMHFPATV